MTDKLRNGFKNYLSILSGTSLSDEKMNILFDYTGCLARIYGLPEAARKVLTCIFLDNMNSAFLNKYFKEEIAKACGLKFETVCAALKKMAKVGVLIPKRSFMLGQRSALYGINEQIRLKNSIYEIEDIHVVQCIKSQEILVDIEPRTDISDQARQFDVRNFEEIAVTEIIL